MFCAKCGKEQKDDAKFCHNCGDEINKSTPVKTSFSQPNSIEAEVKSSQTVIKCGNCAYMGKGEPARSIIAQIFAWISVFFAPIITILYFTVTHKYRCPECKSTFVGIRNKKGVFVHQKTWGVLSVFLIVLAVIGIIAFISTLAVVSLNTARIKARDAKRVADIKQIQTALELYYVDNENYPESLNNITDYLENIPSNPKPNDGNCDSNFEYKYVPSIDNSNYTLFYCLGEDIINLKAGRNVVSSMPIENDYFVKEESIRAIVEEAKKQTNLPTELSDTLTLVDITAESNAIRYQYFFHDVDINTISNKSIKKSILPDLCKEQDIVSILNQGINIEYSYSLKDAGQTFFVFFTKEDCLN